MAEKITVIDSIMGSGKTTAMFDYINQHPETQFIFVTPFLKQIDRANTETNDRLKSPFQLGDGKLVNFHKLLVDGKDIATTHALMMKATQETFDLIRQSEATLILDESLSVLCKYNDLVKELDEKTVNRATVDWLINKAGHITVDEKYNVKWTCPGNDDYQFSEIERLAKDGSLKCVDGELFWEFPIEFFRAFKEVFILTYQFKDTTMDAYLKMHDFEYEWKSAIKVGEDQFEIVDFYDDIAERRKYIQLMDIYIGNLNDIGFRKSSFSMRWLENADAERVRKIRNVMKRYRDIVGASSMQILWTTMKKHNFYKKLEKEHGFKYTHQLSKEERKLKEKELAIHKCFLSCNARATCDFAERTVLLYLVNRYNVPEVSRYFAKRGITLDENRFAINELTQWIFRSAVRDGKPIQIFIPSRRMRDLLFDWLGTNEKEYVSLRRK